MFGEAFVVTVLPLLLSLPLLTDVRQSLLSALLLEFASLRAASSAVMKRMKFAATCQEKRMETHSRESG